MEKLLTVEEAAELLGVQRITIARRIREGKLRCIRIGHNVVRIRPTDLEAFISDCAAKQDESAAPVSAETTKS